MSFTQILFFIRIFIKFLFINRVVCLLFLKAYNYNINKYNYTVLKNLLQSFIALFFKIILPLSDNLYENKSELCIYVPNSVINVYNFFMYGWFELSFENTK